MTIHNVYTFYEDPDRQGNAIVSFFRPQNWGDPNEWQYITTTIWLSGDDPRFVSRQCHIWCHPRHDRWEFLRDIGGMLFGFYYPGKLAEQCDRTHLSGDDFWLSEWGKMPPYWDGDEYDPFLDEADEEVTLQQALVDPANIPIALTPAMATIVASLMQFALRHPEVINQTQNLVAVGKPFVEALIEKIISKSGDDAQIIATAFAAGWDESKDVTSEEFDLFWGKHFPDPDDAN